MGLIGGIFKFFIVGLEVDMEIGDRLYFCIWSFFVGVGGGFIGEGGLDGDCVGSW